MTLRFKDVACTTENGALFFVHIFSVLYKQIKTSVILKEAELIFAN